MVLGKVLFSVGLFICVVESAVVVNVFKEDDVEVDANLPHKVLISGCVMRACDQFCRRLSFASGACLPNGDCHCYQFAGQSVNSLLTSSPVSDAAVTKEIELTKCSPSACNQMCQSLGFKGGVCLSDTTCSCGGQSVNSLLTSSPVSNASVTKKIELTKCSPSACNQMCQSLGFKGGVCLSGTTCSCGGQSVDSLLTSSPVSDAAVTKKIELTKCSPSACNQMCESLGFKGGVCLSDTTCSCGVGNERSMENAYYFYQLSDEDEEPKKEVAKVSDCQLRACEQFCRRLGFPGGACVSGSCICDRFKAKKRYLWMQCNMLDCSLMCQDEGYVGGLCLTYGCVCY